MCQTYGTCEEEDEEIDAKCRDEGKEESACTHTHTERERERERQQARWSLT